MTKLFLKLMFGTIFLWMSVMTIRTSMEMSLWDGWDNFAANPWAVATLWDAYFGFLTFYVWVCFKETRWIGRIVWFILIMGLGNIAMSLYALMQLFRLRPDQPVEALLHR